MTSLIEEYGQSANTRKVLSILATWSLYHFTAAWKGARPLSLGFASADSAIFSAPNRNVLRLERNLVLAHILILPPVAPTESLLHVWFQNRCLVSSSKVAELQE
jgi:hypothetical protein